MTRLSLTIGVVAVLTAPPAAHAGEVAGALDADATWRAADSPVVLTADVTVAAGATLVIEPGVRVELDEGVSLIVAGTLVARGTEAAPITFTGRATPSGPAHWRSILFEDSAVDATFDGPERYVSGSILERCVLEHATRAVHTRAASPYLVASTFRDNRVVESEDLADGTAGGAAIFVGQGSAPWIVGNTFEGNVTEPMLAQGGAICVWFADPVIKDNLFATSESVYGGAITTNGMVAPIVGNTFEDNLGLFEGGGISLVSSSPLLANNLFQRNHSFGDGGGVHVCVTCFPHANPLVMDNVIVDNTSEDHGAAGYGAAYQRAFLDNTLVGNVRTDGAVADFAWHNAERGHYPDWVVDSSVAQTWWGTTDRAVIALTIHDGADDPEVGRVVVEPILEAAPAGPRPRVAITTRKIRYELAGDPMPVFLTVYNPGEARELEVLIQLELSAGERVFYRAPLDVPGAERRGDVHHLAMPADSVVFTKLIEPSYPADGGDTWSEGTWHAALFDPATGDRVGEVCSARFVLTPPAPEVTP